MKSHNKIIVTGILFLVFIFSGYTVLQSNDEIPEGWFKAGSSPKSYEVSINKNTGKNGENIVSLRSIDTTITGFGTLMQNFSAEKYLNKRVRFSANVKAINVEQWAGLWMRIDGKGTPHKSLGFDNMQNRPIKGNTDWKYYSVVLDVPVESNTINFGILLAGTGEILFSNLNFEVVDKSVPTTNAGYKPPSEPKNLDLNK
jgi:hypothetical protein